MPSHALLDSLPKYKRHWVGGACGRELSGLAFQLLPHLETPGHPFRTPQPWSVGTDKQGPCRVRNLECSCLTMMAEWCPWSYCAKQKHQEATTWSLCCRWMSPEPALSLNVGGGGALAIASLCSTPRALFTMRFRTGVGRVMNMKVHAWHRVGLKIANKTSSHLPTTTPSCNAPQGLSRIP